ncbi:unnamed protein product [Cyclocybe aegerita]|uniref:Uncharacterized protein n=1 Tax=Cyclocybe aegerita TaxID=1973307 RepID=A0A8S0XR51_CYCAE|nr:unnamed protein product [Cyclocybe aegerita]
MPPTMFAIQAFSLCLAFLAYFGGTLASTSCGLPENATSIEVTALVGKNGVSALECWKIHPDFAISPQPGTVGARVQSIGNISGATVVFFDEKNVTFAGLHPAPAPQWVVFISGGGYVQLPANGEVLPIKTGDITLWALAHIYRVNVENIS